MKNGTGLNIPYGLCERTAAITSSYSAHVSSDSAACSAYVFVALSTEDRTFVTEDVRCTATTITPWQCRLRTPLLNSRRGGGVHVVLLYAMNTSIRSKRDISVTPEAHVGRRKKGKTR